MDESKFTERESEVLRALRWNGDEWSRPMDVGGHDGSHHSRTLAKLHRLGFAERKTYFAWFRNVHKYRAIKTPNVRAEGPPSEAREPAGSAGRRSPRAAGWAKADARARADGNAKKSALATRRPHGARRLQAHGMNAFRWQKRGG